MRLPSVLMTRLCSGGFVLPRYFNCTVQRNALLPADGLQNLGLLLGIALAVVDHTAWDGMLPRLTKPTRRGALPELSHLRMTAKFLACASFSGPCESRLISSRRGLRKR